MNATEKDGKLILELVGRIDTTNAPVMEQEIQAALDEHPSAVPAFDMEKLEYISSAGLRVLLKVVRKSREKVEAYEVSQEVYDIFNTTGFTDLMDVRKAFRRFNWILSKGRMREAEMRFLTGFRQPLPMIL